MSSSTATSMQSGRPQRPNTSSWCQLCTHWDTCSVSTCAPLHVFRWLALNNIHIFWQRPTCSVSRWQSNIPDKPVPKCQTGLRSIQRLCILPVLQNSHFVWNWALQWLTHISLSQCLRRLEWHFQMNNGLVAILWQTLQFHPCLMHQEKQLHVEHCSDACKKWLCGLETFLQNRQGHLKRVDRVVTACNLALEQRLQRLKVPQLSFMGGGFKRPHLLAGPPGGPMVLGLPWSSGQPGTTSATLLPKSCSECWLSRHAFGTRIVSLRWLLQHQPPARLWGFKRPF